MFASRFTRTLAVIAIGAVASCRPPRVAPLQGEVVPIKRLPVGVLPGGRRQLVFKWELTDGAMLTRGDGVARVASPDSVRLDFFLGGGMGSGVAILIGDSLQVPGPESVRGLIPPRPLLWAALGRFDVPAARDTTVRVDAGVLRADIGAPAHWRASFAGDTLVRLERVDGGRLQEWVARTADQVIRYRNESTRRTLSLVINRSDAVASFDPSIWRL